jgi:hypothetical protein
MFICMFKYEKMLTSFYDAFTGFPPDIHTYIHTHIHTYIHTYYDEFAGSHNTYTHTYIHTSYSIQTFSGCTIQIRDTLPCMHTYIHT